MSNREKIRKLQLIELEILKEVVDICNRNNIKYFLMGGTFLGAVRHKGFIPWDDDIDIGMPRNDYEKFIKIIKKELPSNLQFKNFKELENPTIYFSRVEDESAKIKDNSAIVKRVRSAWIDIFPLDGMPNNSFIRFLHKIRLLFLRGLLQYSQFSIIVNQKLPNRPWYEKVLIWVGNIINFEKILDTKKCMYRLDKTLTKYKYEDSKYVVNFMGAYKFKEMFKKEIYEKSALYKFEDLMLVAPKEYDFVLRQMYGDYMKVPPVEEQNKHFSEVIED